MLHRQYISPNEIQLWFWLCQSQIQRHWSQFNSKNSLKNQSGSVCHAVQNGYCKSNWLLPHWNQADHDAINSIVFHIFFFFCLKKSVRFFFLFCSRLSTIILAQHSVMIIDDARRLAYRRSFELPILINHHHHYPGVVVTFEFSWHFSAFYHGICFSVCWQFYCIDTYVSDARREMLFCWPIQVSNVERRISIKTDPHHSVIRWP